jgi:hypothetical protein
LKTQRGFAAAVTLVLALATGANGALFTVVNALLLRPLPFPDARRLVEISIPDRRSRIEDFENVRSIELAGAYQPWNFAAAGSGGVRMAYGFRVTANLIPLLQFRPVLGRALTRADFDTRVVMLGH